MLKQSHFTDLKNKGYTVIKNSIDVNEVQAWKDLWKDVEKQAILESRGVKTYENKGFYNILRDENDREYVWKTQNILRRFDRGKKIIEKLENQFKKIHPNFRFIKDRCMNQRANYHGHLPHQDLSAGSHSMFADEWYTVYISLSDTDEYSGCLWVEDVQTRRTESLKLCDSGCASGNTCFCTKVKVMPDDIKLYQGHKMIPLNLKEGDSVIFDGWVLHGTAANLSEKTRQTLMFTFGKVKDEDLKISDIFDHYNSKLMS
jgi:ectoine hydroxylase-related dioxygenase (phytanoyl-CoA dioxygenase family)